MRARIILFCLLLSTFSLVHSQSSKSWYFGISLELTIPLGDFHSINGVGVGGMARAGYLVSDNVLVTAGTGYLYFSPGLRMPLLNEISFAPGSWVIPVVGGARYLFNAGNDSRPFLGGETGLFIVHMDFGLSGVATIGQTESHFGVSPLAGVRFRSQEDPAVDALVKYSLLIPDASLSWLSVEGGGEFHVK